MRSLRQQLQRALLLALLPLLAVFAIGLGYVSERLIHSLVATRLTEESEVLLGQLQWDAAGTLQLNATLPASFTRAFSGHYFVIKSADQRLVSDSLWEQSFDTDRRSSVITHELYETPGPLAQRLLVRYAVYKKQGHDVHIWLAEDMAPHYAPMWYFYLVFIIFTALALLLIVWIQRRVILRALHPLNDVRDAVASLRIGELERLSETVPVEIAPLVREINRLSGQLQQRIERGRHAVGNLAHALKTPLTLLQQISEEDIWKDFPAQQSLLQQQLKKLQGRIEEELQRARIVGASRPGEEFNPGKHLPALVETVRRVHQGRKIVIEYEAPDVHIPWLNRDDMLELLGNLLDNACKWANAQVSCVIHMNEGVACVIEDDGGDTELENLRQRERGLRWDERTSGHGLGLTICDEIVQQYHGLMRFERSERLGGIRVEIQLPPPA